MVIVFKISCIVSILLKNLISMRRMMMKLEFIYIKIKMNRYSLSLDAREGKNGRGDPYMKNMF